MRIVYLADAPYIHTQRWVRHFVGAGHDAHVISFRRATIEGAAVHYIDGFETIGKARYVVHARRVRALISELRPELLHALHLTSYGFLAGLSGFQPSVVSVWGTDILEAPALTPLHAWITRHALRRAGAITATGLRLAEATLAYTPLAKPVAVIPYGVDVDRFRPSGGRHSDDTVVIGAVARLSPEKGFDLLLRSVASLRERLALRVALAGDGPSKPALERLAAELGIADAVTFAGELPHDEVPSFLGALDIFVIPSTAEGFGVAAVEAAASALPVVGSDVHGIPDVVLHERTGLLVPPRDVAALASAIERLAGDPALRAALGGAGRSYVEQEYDWRENARLMERLYADLAGRP